MNNALLLKQHGVSALALALTASSSFALGIRVFDQDARAVARGNAFAATADNPSAIYYNPAGITQLEGMNSRMSVYGIYLKDQYRKGGTSLDTLDNLGWVSGFYSTYTPKDSHFSFGLGTYAPYGLSLEWPRDTQLSLAGRAGRMMFLSINPVVAYKICDSLSLAAGPTINYSQIALWQGLPNIRGQVIHGSELQFKGDDWGLGASAGLLWKPHEKHSFGFTYRSGTSMEWQGHSTASGVGPASGRVEGQASFDFPNVFTGGYSFRPTPKWNVEFNLDWTDWTSVKTVSLQNEPSPSPYLASKDLRYNWQSSFVYEFGVTRLLDNGWAISAGYAYSENSVPDSTFAPTVPDSDRHVFSVGVGRSGKKWSWDLAYQFAYGPERTISNGGPPAGTLANGNYTFISHAIAVSVGYHF